MNTLVKSRHLYASIFEITVADITEISQLFEITKDNLSIVEKIIHIVLAGTKHYSTEDYLESDYKFSRIEEEKQQFLIVQTCVGSP